MSDLLAAAASSLGIPEHLLERAAVARAAADGTTYEAVLAAWSGDTPLPPPPAQTAPEPPPTTPASVAVDAPEVPEPDVKAAAAVAVASPPRMASRERADARPRLEGLRFHPILTWIMMALLFVAASIITLVGPINSGGDSRHVVTDPALSTVARQGRSVYMNQGCGYCHTQLVRPVLADVGLGPVTESWADSLDTATFGVQRIGPDLAHIGSRNSYLEEDEAVTAGDLAAFLSEPRAIVEGSTHPAFAYLSDDDLTALATYLTEMK